MSQIQIDFKPYLIHLNIKFQALVTNNQIKFKSVDDAVNVLNFVLYKSKHKTAYPNDDKKVETFKTKLNEVEYNLSFTNTQIIDHIFDFEDSLIFTVLQENQDNLTFVLHKLDQNEVLIYTK